MFRLHLYFFSIEAINIHVLNKSRNWIIAFRSVMFNQCLLGNRITADILLLSDLPDWSQGKGGVSFSRSLAKQFRTGRNIGTPDTAGARMGPVGLAAPGTGASFWRRFIYILCRGSSYFSYFKAGRNH